MNKIKTKAAAVAAGLLLSQAAQAANNHMDVVALYSTFSKNWVNERAQTEGDMEMKVRIRAGIAATNQIFEDSGLDLQISLSYLDEYEAPLDSTQGAAWQTSSSAGQGGRAREELGADFILVWSNITDADGYAIGDRSGVALVNYWVGAGSANLIAHEIGHNLNIQHSHAHEFTANNEDGTGPQLYHTLMGRNINEGTFLPRFSNARQTFRGSPLGDADHDSIGVGSSDISRLCNINELNPGGTGAGAEWIIKNRATNRVITVPRNSLQPGNVIDQWNDLGQSNQKWTFDPRAEDGTTVLRSKLSKWRYLGVMGDALGASATIEGWQGDRTRFRVQSTSNGFVQLKNAVTSQVLFPDGGATGGNGRALLQWYDWDQPTTQWYLERAD